MTGNKLGCSVEDGLMEAFITQSVPGGEIRELEMVKRN